MTAYFWPSLVAVAVWTTGCTAIPGTLKSKQVGKLAAPVRDLAVVFVEGKESAQIGPAFGEKLTRELQQRLNTRNVSTATYYFGQQDSDLDSKFKTATSGRQHGHQLVIVPSLVIRRDLGDFDGSPTRHIVVGFMLSETSPPRLVWQGDGSFIGTLAESMIADQLVERLTADGILK